MTTGTTLSECARVLKQAGARTVWAATVARAFQGADLPEAADRRRRGGDRSGGSRRFGIRAYVDVRPKAQRPDTESLLPVACTTPAWRATKPPQWAAMHAPVLVLNASYEPINVCAARRAIILVLKGVAMMEEAERHMSCMPPAWPCACRR